MITTSKGFKKIETGESPNLFTYVNDNVDKMEILLPTGTNTGDETTTTLGNKINGATAKTTPVDNDMFGLMDSADSNVLKKISWLNLKNAMGGGTYAIVAANSDGVSAGDYVGVLPEGIIKAVVNSSGSPLTVVSTWNDTTNKVSICEVDTNKFVVSWYASASSVSYCVLTVSDTTVSKGTIYTISSLSAPHDIYITQLTTNVAVLSFTESVGNDILQARVLTVSGTTISAGAAQTIKDAVLSGIYTSTCKALSSTKLLFMYSTTYGTDGVYVIAATVSGNTITPGTAVSANANLINATNIFTIVPIDASTAVLAYAVSATSTRIVACTVSGTTITLGSDIGITTTATSYPCGVKVDSTHVIIKTQTTLYLYSLSGTTLTQVSTLSESSNGIYNNIIQLSSTRYAYSNNANFIIIRLDSNYTMTIYESYAVTWSNVDMVNISTNRVLSLYTNGSNLVATVFTPNQVKPIAIAAETKTAGNDCKLINSGCTTKSGATLGTEYTLTHNSVTYHIADGIDTDEVLVNIYKV